MIGRREADGSSEEKSGPQEDRSLQEECGSITVSLKDKTERLLFQCFIAGRSDKSDDSGVHHHFTCGFDFGTLYKEEGKNLY